MRVNIRALLLSAFLALLLVLAGCKPAEVADTPTIPPTPEQTAEGDVFLSSGFKIRTEMKMKSSVSTDPLIFEVYVDTDGDGAGMVGYKDNVYDVYLVGGQVYVTVSAELSVHITDVNAWMIPGTVPVAGSNDLKSLGFSMLDGRVVTYNGSTDTVDMVSRYEPSVSEYTPAAISQSNNMTTGELLKYFFDNASTVYVEPSEPVEEDPERQSFYANSEFGVVIHGVNYSLGDYCAPYTYFEGMVPQGMNTREEYKQDEKVVFTYVSYISSDGDSTFMTTDGYVQAIATSSDFVFLDVIKRGMPAEELQKLLGIGLKKDELETFEPIVEGLEAVKSSNGILATYGDMTIEFITKGKEKTLSSITITNYLDFRS